MVSSANSIPLVSICCVTYNHERFIAQCLDGFVMQKTNFAFEILVHEDASPDKTADIVKEYEIKYPHLFRCVYQSENQFLKQNVLVDILFQMARGKYIALCEGDDYWTDPYKLQKQIDFLESQPGYILCGHIAHVIKNQMLTSETIGNFPGNTFTNEDFSRGYKRIPTASMVFRNSKAISHPLMSSGYGGDRTLLFLLSNIGKIKVLDFVGSVYRVHGDSLESSYRFDKKKLAQRNIDENKMYLQLVEPKYGVSLARKIRWNYFYLFLMHIKEVSISKALLLLPELLRYQLMVMGFVKIEPSNKNVKVIME